MWICLYESRAPRNNAFLYQAESLKTLNSVGIPAALDSVAQERDACFECKLIQACASDWFIVRRYGLGYDVSNLPQPGQVITVCFIREIFKNAVRLIRRTQIVNCVRVLILFQNTVVWPLFIKKNET